MLQVGTKTNSMNINNKYDIGQEVVINHINCKGYVSAIRLSWNGILEYEVSYYLGDNYMVTTLDEYQFEAIKEKI